MKIDELEAALNRTETSGLTKEQALAKIEEKLAEMQAALRTAQRIADEHSLTFQASLGLPDGNPGRDYEYGAREVEGTYTGKGTNKYGEEIENGYWHWENSSLNC